MFPGDVVTAVSETFSAEEALAEEAETEELDDTVSDANVFDEVSAHKPEDMKNKLAAANNKTQRPKPAIAITFWSLPDTGA